MGKEDERNNRWSKMSVSIPNDPQEQMGQLVSDSSRPSKFDSITMNISTELAIAQFSQDPLQKIRHILEAFFFLDENDRLRLLPDEKERATFSRMYDLCEAFMKRQELPPDEGDRRALISFTFEDSEVHLYFGDFALQYASEENVQNFRSGAMSLASCILLENLFVIWAIREVTSLSRKILKMFVSGETWEATLALMKSPEHVRE